MHKKGISMDKIKIKRLEVFANHGVFEEEQRLGQKFYVSCTMYLSTRKAGMGDSLEHTLNYGSICHQIHTFLREHTYKLLETAVEELAKELLYTNELLQGVDIEIEKPWAPIGLHLETAAVEIHRQWHKAYIAIGSNMGDREQYLRQGVEALEQCPDIRVKKVSDWIETEPYGVVDQDRFLNGCMEIETLLPPEELLTFLQKVELDNERVRDLRWGPRTLDLDMIFYDNEIIDTDRLKVPHVDMHNRDFVLVPLKQIAPNYCHPVLHKTIDMLLKELK